MKQLGVPPSSAMDAARLAELLPISGSLTDAATIAVGTPAHRAVLTVTLAGNRTLGNPSGTFLNGHQFQTVIRQDGTGSRTLAYGSDYAFSDSIPSPTLTTGASKTDTLGWQFDATKAKWILLAIKKGS